MSALNSATHLKLFIPVRICLALALLGAIWAAAPTLPVHACSNAIVVANTNDSGAGSLRQAINDVCAGGTITFAPALSGATITLTSGELAVGQNLTIDGRGLAMPITVSGNNASRTFNISLSTTVTLEGLTISGGYSNANGGGIYNKGRLTVNKSTISSNNSNGNDGGGGIYSSSSGELNVDNSTFSGNNSKNGKGGAIDAYGTLVVNNSNFSGNSSIYEGGGIFCSGTITINKSTFSDNVTTSKYYGYGGGLDIYGGTATVTNSMFNHNTANADNISDGSNSTGGGIEINDGTVKVANSTFYNNIVNTGGDLGSAKGAGIDVERGNVTVSNSTFYGNHGTISGTHGSSYGGGIFNYNGTVMAANNTFFGNTANYGGGIYNYPDGTLTYTNNLLAGSNSSNGYDCYNMRGTITAGSKNNLLQYETPSAQACGTKGTNYATTSAPLLGSLADNGGWTQTAALQTGSPAINTGDYATCTSASGAAGIDQRGMPRTNGLNQCDIGAYEASDYTTFSVDLGGSNPANGTVLASGPAALKVVFNHPVDTDSGTQTSNYLLVTPGGNGSFDTQTCKAGLGGDDASVPVNSVSYDEASFTATLNVNGGAPLPNGSYKLFACGTTSIYDRGGVKLNNGASDNTLSFSVYSVGGVGSLPSTGFAPGEVTDLPAQAQSKAYSAEADLTLEIPVLGVYAPIVGVPQGSGWDVSWLGSRIGYLEGSAYPSLAGNSVLAGHVTDADGNPGVFTALGQLRYGQQVVLHAWGQTFTYEVRTVDERVKPNDMRLANRHEYLPWLTLVTCRGWDANTHSYDWRTVVRAVLVKVGE